MGRANSPGRRVNSLTIKSFLVLWAAQFVLRRLFWICWLQEGIRTNDRLPSPHIMLGLPRCRHLLTAPWVGAKCCAQSRWCFPVCCDAANG